MKPLLLLATLAALAASAGCIASERLEPGQLDGWTALHQAPSALGPCKAFTVGERTVPGQWIFRQNPSLIWSAFSLVRAADRLEDGADEIEILVSPQHAVALADLMARGRAALKDMDEVCEFEKPVDGRRWAEGIAAALAGLGDVVREATAGPAAASAGAEEPLGMSAGPILHLLAQYLNQRTGGMLLDDVPSEDAGRLQTILVQMVLRVGFAAAGRQQPEGLREAVEAEITRTDALDQLKPRLADLLAGAVEQAPPAAASGSGMAGPVKMVLSYAPKALQAMEMLARQWDRMDHLAITFHECQGEPVVAVTLAVLEGKEVRLEDMVMFQPVLALTGTSRIIVQPDLKPTGETVIAFEPGACEVEPPAKPGGGSGPDRKVGGTHDAQAAPPRAEGAAGGVDIRFEGAAWGLAKLLVLPLASGRLREIRVSVGEPGQADRIINVALVLEADGAKGDPRRLIQFQDVRRRHVERGPFHIRTVTDRTEQVFNYLTPEKRYTYTRTKTPETE